VLFIIILVKYVDRDLMVRQYIAFG